MAPKRITIQPGTRQPKSNGYISDIYRTLTSEENSSVVISVALFGAAVAFFNSEWSDVLLPGF